MELPGGAWGTARHSIAVQRTACGRAIHRNAAQPLMIGHRDTTQHVRTGAAQHHSTALVNTQHPTAQHLRAGSAAEHVMGLVPQCLHMSCGPEGGGGWHKASVSDGGGGSACLAGVGVGEEGYRTQGQGCIRGGSPSSGGPLWSPPKQNCGCQPQTLEGGSRRGGGYPPSSDGVRPFEYITAPRPCHRRTPPVTSTPLTPIHHRLVQLSGACEARGPLIQRRWVRCLGRAGGRSRLATSVWHVRRNQKEPDPTESDTGQSWFPLTFRCPKSGS